MSKPYPREFRDDFVRVAPARGPGVPQARIAADFGVGKSSLQNWIREATQEGTSTPTATAESAEARELRRRVLLPAARGSPGPAPLGHRRSPTHRARDLDRTHLPPPPQASRPRQIDPDRVRDHQDHSGRTRRLRTTVGYPCSSPDRDLQGPAAVPQSEAAA